MKRYDCEGYNGCMPEREDGEYVRYADVEPVVETVKEAIEAIMANAPIWAMTELIKALAALEKGTP